MDSRRQITGLFTDKALERLFQGQMSEKQAVAGSTAFKELLSDRPILMSVFLPI